MRKNDSDDEFDQRLEYLREEIVRSGDQGQKSTLVQATSSRVNRPMWLLALSTFLGVFWYMWDKTSSEPPRSMIIAAMVATIVLSFMQFAIWLVAIFRKNDLRIKFVPNWPALPATASRYLWHSLLPGKTRGVFQQARRRLESDRL